jgi:hypothetical protein
MVPISFRIFEGSGIFIGGKTSPMNTRLEYDASIAGSSGHFATTSALMGAEFVIFSRQCFISLAPAGTSWVPGGCEDGPAIIRMRGFLSCPVRVFVVAAKLAVTVPTKDLRSMVIPL